ncbi:hypothetical protein C8035_v002625 [Colletotrichum spinosum]|uniref:SWIM-type domain-containing protein n=1 Tax=Colletotrichum spinosum TaxID=1347390 RepID=A0A4R8QD01_9PEZI|nr:hypothetical protein C8035_v002625 [Colletotrichum spinosum]
MNNTPPSSSQPKPAPRAVLTSLITSLTSHAPSAPTPPSSNAFRTLPQSHRQLLITLHVLFPSLLLPALDLLDRHLVTRILRDETAAALRNPSPPPGPEKETAGAATDATEVSASSDDENGASSSPSPVVDFGGRAPVAEPADPTRREPVTFHLVRSAAAARSSRRKQDSGATTYIVHLDAWNCTCASFAFEAFPPGAHGQDIEILDADMADVVHEGPDEWEFGGLSLDGKKHGGVPCCKHLLACLLSEQWGSVLGKYAMEMRLCREEIADLVVDV